MFQRIMTGLFVVIGVLFFLALGINGVQREQDGVALKIIRQHDHISLAQLQMRMQHKYPGLNDEGMEKIISRLAMQHYVFTTTPETGNTYKVYLTAAGYAEAEQRTKRMHPVAGL